jgi:hypothetical protein
MIQVGAATQFDSTSQNYVPKKLLQQPPLQKLGSEQPVLIIILKFKYTVYFHSSIATRISSQDVEDHLFGLGSFTPRTLSILAI